MDNTELERKLAAWEKWHEKDYVELRHRVERHNRVLFGDESDREASGLVKDVRLIEAGQSRIERLVTIAIVASGFQLFFMLLLFVLMFRFFVP